MTRPAVCVLTGLLAAMPPLLGPAGGGGEAVAGSARQTTGLQHHTLPQPLHVEAAMPPDTVRPLASSDTTRRLALAPDTTPVPAENDKPTRKTTLLTLLAIAALTISTLLLYNVRSR